MAKYVKVAREEDIPDDTGLKVEAEGCEIALFKVDGKVYAIDSVCPHQGGPLDEGGLQGDEVMCPWHGWQFNVKNGECSFNPSIKTQSFNVKVETGDVYVEV